MDVAIVESSMTDFGRRDAWLQDLLTEAATACLDDAGVDARALDHCYVANMAGGEFEGRTGAVNALVHDIGAIGAYTQRVDQTSASGGAGVYAAWQSIASGASDLTLLVGGEKMTHRETADSTDVIASLTHPTEYKHGVTLPSLAGLTARTYLEETDATREALADVAVKNHANATANPHAQFHTTVTREDVLTAPTVADPLGLYDFCPVTDGASALLLCPVSQADQYADDYVVISGVGGATDTHVVHERPDPTWLGAVADSSERALSMADRSVEAVDVAELHDMVTLLEPLQVEALGLADRGEGWRWAAEGRTTLDGDLPVNPSGGLKAKGHPLGASGVAQVHELTAQLTGTAGERQVRAKVGLATSIGGFGNCVTTTVLEVGR